MHTALATSLTRRRLNQQGRDCRPGRARRSFSYDAEHVSRIGAASDAELDSYGRLGPGHVRERAFPDMLASTLAATSRSNDRARPGSISTAAQGRSSLAAANWSTPREPRRGCPAQLWWWGDRRLAPARSRRASARTAGSRAPDPPPPGRRRRGCCARSGCRGGRRRGPARESARVCSYSGIARPRSPADW